MSLRLSAAVLVMAMSSGMALGQVSAPPPANSVGPLLYVRFLTPPGSSVAFYPGTSDQKIFEAPVTVGLRPGYCFRVQIKDLPERPTMGLYPTLEVRGALKDAPNFNCAQFPAPVVIDDTDLKLISQGAYVVKVVYLEHPDQAFPVATQKDQPIQLEVRPGEDPLQEARLRGRPLLIVRFGERAPTSDELLHATVPNTILLPNETGLAQPPRPPSSPALCFPVTDPLHGRNCPEEERICDGGDRPPGAAFGPEGKLTNVDPQDAVAEYVTSKGDRKIAVSNKVCICVPRFAVVRGLLLPNNYEGAVGLRLAELTVPQQVFRVKQPPYEQLQVDQLRGMRGRIRASENVNTQGLLDISQLVYTALAIGKTQDREIVGVCKECPPPDCPLVLQKWVDKGCAQIGEIVTFTLRYTNPGGQPIENVAVVDSLTARLEYVPGSAKSDRPAMFTTQPNEAGSLKLRWEISGKLPPGQSGTLSFQARIR